MDNEMTMFTVRLSGQVQGVGFRLRIVERAQELGLVGYVRNLADGRVEICAEGPRIQLSALLEQVTKHDPYALVSNTKVRWDTPGGQFASFEIAR